MKRIICDTNIWYKLGKGEFTFEVINELDLNCTLLSLYELILTEKLRFDFITVSNACKAILCHSKGLILYSPISHLYNLSNPMSSEFESNQIMKVIEYIANADSLDSEYQSVLEKQLKFKTKTIQNYFVNYISNKLYESKTQIFQNQLIQNKFKQLNKTKNIKDAKTSYLKEIIIGEIKSNYPKVKDEFFDIHFWQEIDFYIKSRLKYLDLLKFNSTKMNIEENDVVDMLNLVYVNENCLYWTEDKKWLNIFREAKLQEYLYFEN